MEDFVENAPFTVLKKSLNLGTPIHCSDDNYTALFVDLKKPLNLEPRKQNVEVLQLKTLKYNLNHVRKTTDKIQSLNIGLDITLKTFIGLNITIGSVDYDTKYKSTLDTNHVQVYYYREDYVERLMPNEEVRKEIIDSFSNLDKATHIITECTYGAHLIADIVIKSKTTTKMVSKSAAGLGVLVIGPISAGIEAAFKAVLSMNPDDAEVDITVTCSHDGFDKSSITNVDQLFAKIEELKGKDGKPLQMYSVPIKQFLPDIKPPEPSNKLISTYILSILNDSMNYIEPFTTFNMPKDVLNSNLLTKIRDIEPRLKVLLMDPGNDLTKDILSMQEKASDGAKDLFFEGKEIIKQLTKGATSEEIIKPFLEKITTFKNLKHDEVEPFFLKGKEQLSLVNSDDVDEFTKAEFFGSEDKLQEKENQLKSTIKPKPYIVIKAKQLAEGKIPNSFFLKAYILSAKMEVLILFPNANAGKEFTMKLQRGSVKSIIVEHTEVGGFEKMMMILDILSALFGLSTSVPTSRWYQVHASKNDIAVPLREKEFPAKLYEFIEKTYKEFNKVRIFQTFISLKDHILRKENSSKLIICLPTNSYANLQDANKAFEVLVQKGQEKMHYEFVVGEFELEEGSKESPLILVFRGGKLMTGCLDWLDILRLDNFLYEKIRTTTSIQDFTTLNAAMSTFYPIRTSVYLQLKAFFQASSVHQESILVYHPNVLDPSTSEEETQRQKINTALDFCSAYLDSYQREEKMVTVLIKQLITIRPTCLPILEKMEWDRLQGKFINSNIFGNNQRSAIRSVFMDLLLTTSPELMGFAAFLYTLDYSIKSTQYKDLKEMMKSLSFKHPSMSSNSRIAGIKTKISTGLAKNPVDVSELKLALQDSYTLILELKFESKEESLGANILQDIISLLPIPDEDSPPDDSASGARLFGSWNDKSEIHFHNILKNRVLDVEWSSNDRTYVETWLTDRLVLKIVHRLGSLQYPAWHQQIAENLKKIKPNLYDDKIDYGALMNLVKEIADEAKVKKDFRTEYFIWSNPSFETIILDAIKADESKSVESLAKALIEEEPATGFKRIPLYVPTSIAKYLRKYAIGN